MKQQIRACAAVLILLTPSLFFPLIVRAAESNAQTSVQADSATAQKLDQILQGQKDILKNLDEMKKELYIIKIRSTKR